MSSRPEGAERNAGFALIEVLVAAAVAGLLLVLLIRAFATTWMGITSVREEAEAMMVARAVLHTAGQRSTLAAGAQQGMAGRYGWIYSVEPIAVQTMQPASASADTSPTRSNTSNRQASLLPGNQNDDEDTNNSEDGAARAKPQQSWTLYRVAVVVSAPSGRRLTLDTYRLGQTVR